MGAAKAPNNLQLRGPKMKDGMKSEMKEMKEDIKELKALLLKMVNN